MQNPCAVANSGNLTLKVTALVTKGRRRREDDALKNVPSICGFDVHFFALLLATAARRHRSAW